LTTTTTSLNLKKPSCSSSFLFDLVYCGCRDHLALAARLSRLRPQPQSSPLRAATHSAPSTLPKVPRDWRAVGPRSARHARPRRAPAAGGRASAGGDGLGGGLHGLVVRSVAVARPALWRHGGGVDLWLQVPGAVQHRLEPAGPRAPSMALRARARGGRARRGRGRRAERRGGLSRRGGGRETYPGATRASSSGKAFWSRTSETWIWSPPRPRSSRTAALPAGPHSAGSAPLKASPYTGIPSARAAPRHARARRALGRGRVRGAGGTDGEEGVALVDLPREVRWPVAHQIDHHECPLRRARRQNEPDLPRPPLRVRPRRARALRATLRRWRTARRRGRTARRCQLSSRSTRAPQAPQRNRFARPSPGVVSGAGMGGTDALTHGRLTPPSGTVVSLTYTAPVAAGQKHASGILSSK
jgi:hypothetical protein